MAADYTYEPGVVVDVLTRELSPGTVFGSLVADPDNPIPVTVYDMNGSVIPNIPVSDVGTYGAFRADILTGSLSFGSGIYLPVKSIEYQNFAAQAAGAQTAAEAAASDAAAAVAAAQAAQAAAEAAAGGGGGGTPTFQYDGNGDPYLTV